MRVVAGSSSFRIVSRTMRRYPVSGSARFTMSTSKDRYSSSGERRTVRMSKTSKVLESISETLIWLAGVEVGEEP
jgi:hypothetical protein